MSGEACLQCQESAGVELVVHVTPEREQGLLLCERHANEAGWLLKVLGLGYALRRW